MKLKLGKLQYVKTWKSQYLNSIFQLNYTKYEKKIYDEKFFTT